jgi:uncharacterized protein YjeT (DUF2065 family)
MIAWSELLSAMALVLVIEGIMPFISPKGWRQTMLQASQLEDKALRSIGLASMLAGAVLLYVMR